MNYAVSFNRNFKYFKEVDEIILYWSTKDDIIDFINEKYRLDQRVIITIDLNDILLIDDEYINKIIIPILVELGKTHSNFAVRFQNGIPKLETLDNFKLHNIKYFFYQFCSNWDSLNGLVSLGASDVYITEELGFDLKDVSAFCKPRRVKVRVFPNIAQNGGNGLSNYIPDMVKFFIRPEDTEIYEPYVDVFEIWGESRISVLYEIYKNKQWMGNIQDIIVNFQDDVPNTSIMDHFAQVRTGCRKNCLKGKQCTVCKTIKEISIGLNKAGLTLKRSKE